MTSRNINSILLNTCAVVASSETQPVLQPPPGFQYHRASVDTSDLDLEVTKQQQQQPVFASLNHQNDLELEIGAMRAHIERLEADNQDLQQALDAERQAKLQKKKRRRGSKSDSSSSSSSSDEDDEHNDKLSKKKSKVIDSERANRLSKMSNAIVEK